jgi:hypothetical protein
VTFIDVKEFWLDVTGSYPGLTAGQMGYLGNGQGDILYMTLNGFHYPLSQNIENLQFEYNGDLNQDGALDGFLPWNNLWTPAEISMIQQIRMQVLGRTPQPFVSLSGPTPTNLNIYQRPLISNDDPAVTIQPDKHKRFILESTSNVRNLTLNLYNTGTR